MSTPAAPHEIPPIVLLVDQESDSREMYATSLEMAGFWVAVAQDPAEAMRSVAELRPTVIIASLAFDGRTDGFRFVRALQARTDTREIPLVVLSGRPIDGLPGSASVPTTALLLKPVRPDALASKVRELIAASHDLRKRSEMLAARVQRLIDKSEELRGRRNAVAAPLVTARRACPHCGGPLVWVDRSTFDDAEYDCYRPCGRGCGLYCFNRTANCFVKLS